MARIERSGEIRLACAPFFVLVILLLGGAGRGAFAQESDGGGSCFGFGPPAVPGAFYMCREKEKWTRREIFYGFPYTLIDAPGPDGRPARVRQRGVAYLFVEDVLIGRLSDFSPVLPGERNFEGDFRLEFRELESETYASEGNRTGYRLADEVGRVAEVYANGIYIGRIHRGGMNVDLDALATGVRKVTVRPDIWQHVPSSRD